MKKSLAAAVLSLTVLAPVGLAASPAAADTETCVSRTEFRRVERGWSIARVRRVFDVTGRQSYFASGEPSIDWPATQGREYRPCTRYSYVSVDFEKYRGDVWRVTGKSAYWG
jgi:hypothetical protein